jgi:CRISPR-associated endonuclease Csn1
MSKIIGIDLGTSSIGLSVRDTDKGYDLRDQLDFFTSAIFRSGVGVGKQGEFSYAAKRRGFRCVRNLYKVRKYRKWSTLKLLIENGLCPLPIADWERWCKYDKARGLCRKYPVDVVDFERWIRLDFDGDGKADYTSPYQLRAELMERQFDFKNQIERYKLGRALYHMAQRRGFKSSKGETLKDEKVDTNDDIQDVDVVEKLKESELNHAQNLENYRNEHHLPTIGCALAFLEKSGVRVRASEYTFVRSQLKDEIHAIFEYQQGLDTDSELYNHLVSEKKNEGTIFYKNPLRSQKGSVGKCTLEPNKPRCPISHPEFEKFRAWHFINDIRYKLQPSTDNLDWLSLTIEQKQKLYRDKFLRVKTTFKFEEIRGWMEKELGLVLKSDGAQKTVNFKDSTSVSGCPIIGRLKNLLGDDWENISFQAERVNEKTGEIYKVTYDALSLWHICFSSEDEDFVYEFAHGILHFDDSKSKRLVSIWGAIPQGYAMLSLKAIRNINRFLQKGLKYSDAALLAKLPEIFGEASWQENEDDILSKIVTLTEQNRRNKRIINIANTLIADYKSKGYNEDAHYNERFAEYNTQYKLDEDDLADVRKATLASIGNMVWNEMSELEKDSVLQQVANLYQQFFASSKRTYYILPRLIDDFKCYLSDHFEFLHCPNNFHSTIDPDKPCQCPACKLLNKLYHPSMIEFYKPAQLNDEGQLLLGSPVIGALKNPMAMRVLHTLRNRLNILLKNGIIDSETRVVVELARDLNDANERWAIEAYDRQRENENKEFENILKEYYPTRQITSGDIHKARLLLEQCGIDSVSDYTNSGKEKVSEQSKRRLQNIYQKEITKYRLWLEQGGCCIYTGHPINISTLLDDNLVDIEHTIPRSLSFDDSMANLTLCDAHYNRFIKKNGMPTQMMNYDHDANGYSAILPRLKFWKDKVNNLKERVDYWASRSKRAVNKDSKDTCIRQRHLWQMEFDYWNSKLQRFTLKEVTSGFRNNQLNDTRIISRYAYLYLKTVFSRVEVQKGNTTAAFRKIFGLQQPDEKKDRSLHSHHAKDATMLTLIPVSSIREKMLFLFNSMQEENHFNGHSQKYKDLERQLNSECRRCQVGSVSDIDSYIDDNIVVEHISRNRNLTPAMKKVRVRGKILPLRDSEGNVEFCTDANGNYIHDEFGNCVPKAKYYKTGRCIRGKLHGDTFYGAITQAKKDKDGSFLRDNEGKIISGDIVFVVRRKLEYADNASESGFKSWDELESLIVDKSVFHIMRSQFNPDTTFKEACEQGIYMLDRKGNRVNLIRHVRCITSVKNPLKIKRQTYLSAKEYHQYYYAAMGDLYAMCRYQSLDNRITKYQPWSLFNISENRNLGLDDIPIEIPYEKNNEIKLSLTQTIKVGDTILVYQNTPIELYGLSNVQLNNHLYVVRGFETDGNRIVLKKSINAQSDKELGKGESIKNFNELPSKIRCGIKTLKFLVEGTDFDITPSGKISLRNE